MTFVSSPSSCRLFADFHHGSFSDHSLSINAVRGPLSPESAKPGLCSLNRKDWHLVLQAGNEFNGGLSGRCFKIKSGSIPTCSTAACRAAVSISELATEDTPQIADDPRRLDVSSNCVNPVFRASPQMEEPTDSGMVKVLFLSEGNVCRSIYAEAIFNALVGECHLEAAFSCASKATRDYNLGEKPDPRAVQVAEEFQLALPSEARATLFKPSADIVTFDLAIVVDKFVAADVLKEVSVFDTINPQGNYSAKVRRLGDFCKTRRVEDIDDPLYGNMGGPEELDNLRSVFEDIRGSCEGLLQELVGVQNSLREGESLADGVRAWLQGMEALDWMVPPMLQKRNA